MKKQISLTVLLALSIACTALAEPIYVDGTGTELGNTAPPQSSATAAPSTGSSTNADGSITVDGTGSEIAPDTDTDDSDEESTYVWPGYEDTAVTAKWNGSDVLVEALGTYISRVTLNKQTYTVKTSMLVFNTTADEGKQLAIITAPKSGRATMYYKPSSKGDVVVKCDTGMIVPVLETTKSYAKVNYQGAVGYVRNSSLTFVSPAADDATLAYVAYKGNVNSHGTVNVRMNGSSKSRVLMELKSGTLAAVIGVDEDADWAEIEAEGMRCHILTKYLVYANAAAEATPAATEAPAD